MFGVEFDHAHRLGYLVQVRSFCLGQNKIHGIAPSGKSLGQI
jgi:hypothetical protein